MTRAEEIAGYLREWVRGDIYDDLKPTQASVLLEAAKLLSLPPAREAAAPQPLLRRCRKPGVTGDLGPESPDREVEH